MSTIHLVGRVETMIVDEQDRFVRPAIGLPPSGKWTMRGAVEVRFGRIIRCYTMADVREGRVPWFWKNGKQRCFVADTDHGTSRVQMSPGLRDVRVVPAPKAGTRA